MSNPNTSATSTSAFQLIKEKTGVNPLILIAGVLGALTVVFLGQSEQYVTSIVGIVFPAYMSMKAIESEDKNDDTQWCTYWVVFFLFELAELFFGYILHYLPFYFLIKLVFLVWLFFPTTCGANFIYDKILSKFFSKYEVQIDKNIENLSRFSASKSTMSKN